VSTLAFADVPAAQMSDANTLFSTASQLAVGWGSRSGRSAFAWVSRSATGCTFPPAGDQLSPVVCVYRLDLSGGDDRQPASGQNGRQQRVGEKK
jgi:hypothetical protein